MSSWRGSVYLLDDDLLIVWGAGGAGMTTLATRTRTVVPNHAINVAARVSTHPPFYKADFTAWRKETGHSNMYTPHPGQ